MTAISGRRRAPVDARHAHTAWSRPAFDPERETATCSKVPAHGCSNRNWAARTALFAGATVWLVAAGTAAKAEALPAPGETRAFVTVMGIALPMARPTDPGRSEFEAFLDNPPADNAGQLNEPKWIGMLTHSGEQGFTPAQVLLAFFYLGGKHVPLDLPMASRLAHEAAARGNPDGKALAAYADSEMLSNVRSGNGPASASADRKWLETAAELKASVMSGSIIGEWLFAMGLEGSGDPDGAWKAYAFFTLAHERGALLLNDAEKVKRRLTSQQLARAEAMVGATFYSGETHVPKDPAKAALWLGKAAALGDADALTGMGLLYRAGQGVPQDYAKALGYFRAAAAKGDPWAENDIGAMYQNGEGVAVDYAEALRHYDLAAARGLALAKKNLARLQTALQGGPPRGNIGAYHNPMPHDDADDLMGMVLFDEFWNN